MKILIVDPDVIIDNKDYPLVKGYAWYITTHNRVRAHVKGSKPYKKIDLATLIMKPPKGMVVDHINGNPLDNRRCNLRICTQAENCRNKRTKVGAAGYIGVYKRKDVKSKPYVASIKAHGKKLYLGTYKTAKEAAKARDLQARILFREFAVLNFPEKK